MSPAGRLGDSIYKLGETSFKATKAPPPQRGSCHACVTDGGLFFASAKASPSGAAFGIMSAEGRLRETFAMLY